MMFEDFFKFFSWEDIKSLQRINVGCVCADGAGTMCCSLVIVPSIAVDPSPHGDVQCMPLGGSWKTHGES